MSKKLDSICRQLMQEQAKKEKNNNKSNINNAYKEMVSEISCINFENEYDMIKNTTYNNELSDEPNENDNFNFLNENSEFEKAYMGMPSRLNDINLEDEYDMIKHKIHSEEPCDKKEFCVKSKDDFIVPEHMILQHRASSHHFPTKAPPDDSDEVEDSLVYTITMDYLKMNKLFVAKETLYKYSKGIYNVLNESNVVREICHNYDKELKGCSNRVAFAKNVYAHLIIYAKEFEELPENTNIVVFANGTLEIDKNYFRRSSPKDYATFALAIDYDKSRKKMPIINNFLNTVTGGDENLYKRILQMTGYLLRGDNKGKCFFYLMGPRDCGKSVLCALLSLFYPKTGLSKISRVALGKLGDKFALGNIMRSTINICDDIPSSPLNFQSVSTLKMLTGSSEMEGEIKYEQATTFKPKCRLVFTSNYDIRLKEEDSAFESRIVYIPFRYTIPKKKQDKNILEGMKGELQALFNISHEAYKELVADNYMWAGGEQFQPVTHITTSGLAIDKEEVIRDFVSDCCEFVENVVTSTEDLTNAYNIYCRQYGYSAIKGDRFSRDLHDIFYEKIEKTKISNKQRGYKGIILK